MDPLNWDEFLENIKSRTRITELQEQKARRVFCLLRAVGVSNHTANEIASSIGVMLLEKEQSTQHGLRT